MDKMSDAGHLVPYSDDGRASYSLRDVSFTFYRAGRAFDLHISGLALR